MRTALAVAVVFVAAGLGVGAARADDLCTKPHHGAAIDLDLKDADVHDVFRMLADVGHVNLVVNDKVGGKVTIKLKRVAWDAAACAVADLQKLAIDVDGNILVVMPRSQADK